MYWFSLLLLYNYSVQTPICMDKFKKVLKQNLLFFMYSAIGTLADIGALNLLSLIMDESIANIISYATGVMISFFLCRKFVFKVKDHVARRTISTIAVHFVGLIIQELLLDSLLKSGMNLNIAKMITVAENGILMYFLNVFIVFRKYKPIRRKQKKVSETWVFSSLIYGYFFTNKKFYIERSFFICLIPSSRNHVTLPM